MSRMQKVSARVHAGYGSAETGIIAVEILMQLYLLKFYISEVKLDPGLAGLALALAVLWDAFTDPIMGAVSDKTSSRFGRRRLYFLLGGGLLALTFPFLFNPPELFTASAKFVYLLVTYILVKTAMTIIAVPHAAMGGELTAEPDERTKAYGFRLLFGNLGLLLGTIMPGILLAQAANKQVAQATSKGNSAIIIAVVVIFSALITFMATDRYDARVKELKQNLGQFLKAFLKASLQTIKNPVFIPLLIAYFVATMGRTLNSSIALYYYENYLNLSEEQTVIYILGVFVAVISISILFWVTVSRHYGKKWPAFWGIFLLGAGTVVAYPLFPSGSVVGPLVAAVIGGLLVGSIILFDSLVADIVDYDQIKSNKRREGLYFGFWKLSSKASQALGIALAGFSLKAIGFDETLAMQAPEVNYRIALLFGPGVGTLFILAALVFTLLPWSKKIHARVISILERRQASA